MQLQSVPLANSTRIPFAAFLLTLSLLDRSRYGVNKALRERKLRHGGCIVAMC